MSDTIVEQIILSHQLLVKTPSRQADSMQLVSLYVIMYEVVYTACRLAIFTWKEDNFVILTDSSQLKFNLKASCFDSLGGA